MKNVVMHSSIVLLAVSGSSSNAQAQQTTQPQHPTVMLAQVVERLSDEAIRDEPLVRARGKVREAERELKSANFQHMAGVITAVEKWEAEVRLAEAQVRLANVEKQTQAALQHQQTIVARLEQIVEGMTARYREGLVTAREVNGARIRLAEARIQQELQSLVALYEENLAQVKALAETGTAPQHEVVEAIKALEQVRARLAKRQK